MCFLLLNLKISNLKVIKFHPSIISEIFNGTNLNAFQAERNSEQTAKEFKCKQCVNIMPLLLYFGV